MNGPQNNRTLKNNPFLPFLSYFVSAMFWTQTHIYIKISIHTHIHIYVCIPIHINFIAQILESNPLNNNFCSQSKTKWGCFVGVSSLLHAGSNLNAIVSSAKQQLASEKAHSPTDIKTEFFLFLLAVCWIHIELKRNIFYI